MDRLGTLLTVHTVYFFTLLKFAHTVKHLIIQITLLTDSSINKRLARKGSSASRTSRSRTSPRVSNNRQGLSSSDEGRIDRLI